jgi:hypothetical protein
MLVAWLVSLMAALFVAGPPSASPETILDCVQPDLAMDARDVVVTCGRGRTILWTRSRDAGASFEPLRAVAVSRGLALGMHRGPRIATSGGVFLVAAVVQSGSGPPGDLVVWRSSDAGRTWTPSPALNDERGAAREGLHALAAHGDTVVAAWLDLRDGGTTLRTRFSRDAGRTWEADRLLYRSPSGSICECCHPSLSVHADGSFKVLFRNERDGHRDMYLVEASGAARKVGQGTWRLAACPMDGGDLTTTPDGSWLSIWRRETTIFLAGESNREESVGEGRDPAVASGPEGTYLAWTGPEGVLLRRPGAVAPEILDRRGSFAALAGSPGGVVVTWQRNDEVVVRLVHHMSESSTSGVVSKRPRRDSVLY